MIQKLLYPIGLCYLLATPMSLAGSNLKDDIKKNASNNELETSEEMLAKHAKGSILAADEQDELSADVQDLIQEQTNQNVIDLLSDAEDLMNETSELLEGEKTGSETIAIETEIIEKIYEAAKKKQQ